MVVLIACGLSLLELEPLLTDRDFRQRMLRHVEDPLVVSFFQHQYDRWGREQPIFVSPVLNKVSAFLFKPQVRTMLGADDNALDFRRIIDEGKILVINLGCFRDEETQRLLGSLFLTSLEQAAFSRSNQPPHARRPFFCMIDEFPLFCARDQTSLARILSECRKYRLHLGLAHQTIAQLPGQRIQGALENAKLKVIFGTGRQTAEAIARELYMPDPKAIKHEVIDEAAKERTHPVFSALNDQFEVFTQSVQQLRRRRALVKLPDKATVAHVHIPKVPASRMSAGQLDRLKQALAKDAGKPCHVLDGLESEHRPIQRLQNALREIETEAYRAALDLADIEIAGTCDICPVAPPITQAQAHLLMLADVLEQQATLARECAQPSVVVKVEHNGRNGHQS